MFIVFHFKLLLTIFEGNLPSLTTDRFQPVNLLVLTQGPSNRELDVSSNRLAPSPCSDINFRIASCLPRVSVSVVRLAID